MRIPRTEKAAEASEISHHLAEMCKHGQMSAQQNFGMLERIQAEMDVVAEAIARQSEQAQSVGDIIAAVNDLAEQSKQAVAQVRDVLTDIRKASEVAVRAAEQSREAVEAGRIEAGRCIEKTKTEVECANKAREAALRISATSCQQLAGMEQISQAILSISKAGSESVSGTQQVDKEARLLKDLALSLDCLVGAISARQALPQVA